MDYITGEGCQEALQKLLSNANGSSQDKNAIGRQATGIPKLNVEFWCQPGHNRYSQVCFANQKGLTDMNRRREMSGGTQATNNTVNIARCSV